MIDTIHAHNISIIYITINSTWCAPPPFRYTVNTRASPGEGRGGGGSLIEASGLFRAKKESGFPHKKKSRRYVPHRGKKLVIVTYLCIILYHAERPTLSHKTKKNTQTRTKKSLPSRAVHRPDQTRPYTKYNNERTKKKGRRTNEKSTSPPCTIKAIM